MKFESGVHRVQRVPKTESQGRIQTSTATVAVLPEAEEIDVQINQSDLRIDTYCASGPGGQCVNTTYSAVRITHLPTNTVVQSQEQRSQIQNREVCMQMLRARLYEMELEKQQAELGAERQSQIGHGNRSEKIRTYNQPQDRVTDHRIGFNSTYNGVLLGDQLGTVIEALAAAERARSWRRRFRLRGFTKPRNGSTLRGPHLDNLTFNFKGATRRSAPFRFTSPCLKCDPLAHMTQSTVKGHNGPADRLQSVGGACR